MPKPATDTLLDLMRTRAEQASVTIIDGTNTIETELERNPVFRYSDQVRGILDAGLWVWTYAGRPVAFQKVEALTSPITNERNWTYCFATACERSVHVKWWQGREFQSKPMDGRFRFLKDESRAADTPRGRALQLRAIARQFSATIINDPENKNREQMRLLPTPIFEYQSIEKRVVSGAVFGFAFGTNPDLLLLIELRNKKPDQHEWCFATTRMTTGGLHLRWLDHEVWSEDWVNPTPQAFDFWTFFYGPREDN